MVEREGKDGSGFIENLVFVPRHQARATLHPVWIGEISTIRDLLSEGIQLREEDFAQNIKNMRVKVGGLGKSMKSLEIDKLSSPQRRVLEGMLTNFIAKSTNMVTLSHELDAKSKSGTAFLWADFELLTNQNTATWCGLVEELRGAIELGNRNPGDPDLDEINSPITRLVLRTWGILFQLESALKVVQKCYVDHTTSARMKLEL